MYLLMIKEMRYDYRGGMRIWFKTLLLFVVFNEVQLYRQLKKFTCLELAKPSNKQFRLPCNDTSSYHCLLNGNSTNEFEICKTWKWIPKGNCAYLNTYGWNIDARNCSSSAELACPKSLYRSGDNIKYAACYVKKNMNSTARQVRNTTCLELAKSSNLQFRMSCNNTGTYHCLLDQNYTQEYEICMMWKWIPQGKCAYFNMYSGDNIDERHCTSSSHFICPEKQYRSENTLKYSACYIRNNHTMMRPLTSLSPIASNWTPSDSNGGKATSSRILETAEKRIEMKTHPLPIILGIIVPLVSLSVIYFIFMHLKYVPLYRKAYSEASQETSSNREGNEDTVEKQPFLNNVMEDTSESPPTTGRNDENITEARRNGNSDAKYPADMNESDLSEHFEDVPSSPTIIKQRNSEVSTADPVASQETSSNTEGNVNTVENKPFLRNETKDTSESPSTMGHEDENMTEARRNGNVGAHGPANSNESDALDHFEDAASPLTSVIQNNSNVIADDEREDEKSTDSIPGSCDVSEKLDNEQEDEEENTGLFDDTSESILEKTPSTDEHCTELCLALYNLLSEEGPKLIHKVMIATITRKTGKSVETLLNNLTDKGKSTLQELMPEGTPFRILYGLHRIYFTEEYFPKSGWGNPVRDTDIGIGDDVERLNRIQIIARGISSPVTVSVESYIRMLDIMIKALTRLDPDDEFREDIKEFATKITCFETITETKNISLRF